MTDAAEFRRRLKECRPGLSGWRAFEDACIEALTFLLVPPLSRPHIQGRTYSEIDRRDAIFPNSEP